MKYLIGIDGGGTGTTALLSKMDGTVLGMAKGSASSHVTAGKDGSLKVLKGVILDLLKPHHLSLNDCDTTTVGLAGLNHPDDERIYRDIMDKIGLSGEIIVVSDMYNAWASATRTDPGIIVIAGTGATCFGINAAGQEFKALGWDFWLGDQGSGFWIGFQGLLTAMKIYDGRLEKSDSHLLGAMTRHYELTDARDMLKIAYRDNFTKKNVASFARSVAECAEKDDSYARDILNRAGKELGDGVAAVIRQLNMRDLPFPLGLIGGVWQSGEVVLTPFRERVQQVAPQATIVTRHSSPVLGSLMYGEYRRQRLTPAFLKQLEITGAKFEAQLHWK